VLYNLSFRGDTIEYALFGLGMVLLGFTFSAIVSLHYSRLTFVGIGHVGKNRRKETQI
jgi:hypothetical protein